MNRKLYLTGQEGCGGQNWTRVLCLVQARGSSGLCWIGLEGVFFFVLMESCIGRDYKVVLVCTGELQYIRLEY